MPRVKNLGKTGNNVASSARFTTFKIKLLEALEKKDSTAAVLKLCHELRTFISKIEFTKLTIDTR